MVEVTYTDVTWTAGDILTEAKLDNMVANDRAVDAMANGVMFTERTNHVEHHKGQISFPGGARDDEDDSLAATALRETFEEIGVRPDDVEIIGQLDDMVTISNFRVTPFVGILYERSQYSFVLNEHEVAQVVQVPLEFLLDERNLELEVRQHQGRQVLVPAFLYNGHRIWGATARMLHQFIELLR